jgi:hypothetical protein
MEVPRSMALAVLAILGLNCLDMVLTVRHLALGAVELNPLMRELLEHGPFAFATGKHFLVGTCVLALTTQCHRMSATRGLCFVILPAYVLLALYQLALLAVSP